VEGLLSVVDDAANALIDSGLLSLDTSLVATLGNDLGVVGGTTTVPGEKVGGVRGDVSKGALSGDVNKSGLELLGGDIGDGIGGVLGGCQGDVVGQQTGDVRRCHGGAGNGVGGMLATNPGGEDVQTRGEDVSALAVVGEVSTLISQGGGANSDGLLGSSGGVVAGVSVVITGSNSEVNTSVNSGIHSEIQGAGATTTERHVGNATLELLVALLGLLDVSLGRPFNTLDDIGHSTRAVRAKNLDSVNVGLLGNTELLAGNSTRAVSSVTVSILIGITLGDGLAPVSTALEVNVLGVGASINNVGIDTLTTLLGIQVLVEVAEGEAFPVRDTGKTPRGVLLNSTIGHSTDLGVLLNVVNIGMTADLLDDILVEVTSISSERSSNLESVLQAHETLKVKVEQGALLQLHPTGMSGVHLLQPALVSGGRALVNMLLEYDDVGIRNISGGHGGEDRSCIVVDGADCNGRGSCQQREHG